MKLSSRALNSPPSGIRKMFEIANDYEGVINLCIGEPGFITPDNIIYRAKRALDNGHTKYTSNAGVIELRRVLAEKLKRENGIITDPEKNIIVTTGAGEAIFLTLLALVNEGDEVIIPDPGWPNYLGHIALASGKPIAVATYEEDQFSLKAEAVKKAITEKTKVIIINSPSNPTGSVIPKEELIEIGKIAKENDIIIISDEPYEKLIYDDAKHFSLGSCIDFRDHVVTVNSFSKTYAMTGWRVGYAAGPESIIKTMVKLQESVSSCVNSAAQQACIEAITGQQDAVNKMVAEYKRRRDILVEGLNQLPRISCIKPKGAFYAFPNIKELGMSSEEVAIQIIKEVQVVTTPGSAFGKAGEGYLRLSFASSTEDIIEALDRLKRCSLFKK